MNITLSKPSALKNSTSLQITGSKSETNRLLILQALYPNLSIENSSKSDDSKVLQQALKTTNGTVDVHHAGTAMRFLTAYFAASHGADVLITGSQRMQQRPIGILVDALRQLGAKISYVKEVGYPPLHIHGTELKNNKVTLKADVSSQFISALLLIAPSLPSGLELSLTGTITSRPYIEMTLSLLEQLGIPYHFAENKIVVRPISEIQEKTITVESDWSSASYFYSIVALSEHLKIRLRSYRTESLQGDSALVDLYKTVGVETTFHAEKNSIVLQKINTTLPETYTANLANTPDIAQTIAVTCFGLGIGCELKGLHTLKIKETDRLLALKIELEKLGGNVTITEESLLLAPSIKINKHIAIDTYNDHRMAMAFAPLAVRGPLQINHAEVVSKSFPTFWEAMEKVGLTVSR
ncbi:3-phosphoshikimate 1-carboxyvinyltransferase [Marinirhabdus gelatinilytica]|uniref:3-phosphoshikimate 1-carboxyvinyltransferase n=1 Tax=Marinirhabdus gelatinilytica TaxID=1703343 RepID=A0A370Q787_9FLAO|nr:3-phosphoshikimate 1-carboxyvinyltransferase [Marinirhabdus gelatinilytica]RDK84242.1 3-phosphoshikimate 1-carboxyvinyltransferase [Marinirhabdus gelatinilytica]